MLNVIQISTIIYVNISSTDQFIYPSNHVSIYSSQSFQSSDISYPLIVLENAHMPSENVYTHKKNLRQKKSSVDHLL